MKLNKKMKLSTIFTLILSLAFITGCKKDPEGPTKTIWQIVEGDAALSSLEAELLGAGLDATLSGVDTKMTLFAPSNTAMQNLLSTLGIPDYSTIAPDVVQAVLAYHIANQEILAAAITEGTSITTLQGENISVITGNELKTGATSNAVIERSIPGTNGTVHVVSVVLIPPTIGALIVQTLGTVAQPILLASDFSILGSAILKADAYAAANGKPTLVSILITPAATQTYTVFAPVNQVFNTVQITVDTYDGATWYGLLAHHIAPGIYGSGNGQTPLTVETTINTLATNPQAALPVLFVVQDTPTVELDSNNDGTTNGTVYTSNAIPANNGIVYPFAGVLSPM